MKLYIEYNEEGIPPFEKEISKFGTSFVVQEIQVEGTAGHSKKVALEDYIISLKNMFKGINNTHKTGIKTLILKDGYFSEMGFKNGDFFTVKPPIEKDIFNPEIYNIVSIEGHDDLLKEGYYFTRNAGEHGQNTIFFNDNFLNNEIYESDKSRERRQKVKNVHLKGQIDVEKTGIITLKDFFRIVFIIVSQYLPNYSFKIKNIDNDDNKVALEYTYCKELLENGILDIKEDDVFLFFKLVEIILPYLNNKKRFPVYFLDCTNISASVINAIAAFINFIRNGNCYVYLYNVSKSKHNSLKEIKNLEFIMLPNHMKKSVIK